MRLKQPIYPQTISQSRWVPLLARDEAHLATVLTGELRAPQGYFLNISEPHARHVEMCNPTVNWLK